MTLTLRPHKRWFNLLIVGFLYSCAQSDLVSTGSDQEPTGSTPESNTLVSNPGDGWGSGGAGGEATGNGTSCMSYLDSFPTTALTTPNVYYCLRQSLSGNGSISFEADNITLDGQGYSLLGTGTLASAHGHINVTITNLKAPGYDVSFVNQGGAPGLKILNSQLKGLHLAGNTQVTIRGNDIHGGLNPLGTAGDCLDPNTLATVTCATNVIQKAGVWSEDDLIENNFFHAENLVNTRFIQLSFLKRLTFRNNRIQLVNSSGNLLQDHFTVDSVFQGNSIDYTLNETQSTPYDETHAMMIRDDPTRLVFRNNVIHTTSEDCMLIGGPGNERWLDTVNSPATGGWQGRDNLVDSNVCIVDYSPVRIKGNPLQQYAFRHMTSMGGDQFKNNLIYMTGDAGWWGLAVMENVSGLWDHNTIFHGLGGGSAVENDSNGTWTNNILYTAGTGAAMTGGAGAALSSNLLFPGTDPLFADSYNRNLRLQTGSPAIGAGSDRKNQGVDFTTLLIGFAADTIPPRVSIASPKGVTAYAGTVNVQISASDNVGVTRVELYQNGMLVGRSSVAPYSVSFDTTIVPNGNRVLTARAWDWAGNSTLSIGSILVVNNPSWAVSCGADCSGVTRPAPNNKPGCTNHTLVPGCTSFTPQCDGTNTINDIKLNGASVARGGTIRARVEYGCWSNSSGVTGDNVALYHFDGMFWSQVAYFAPGSLPNANCDTNADGADGYFEIDVPVPANAAVGTHYFRAIEGSTQIVGNVLDACPVTNTSSWGDLDDIAFTVQ